MILIKLGLIVSALGLSGQVPEARLKVRDIESLQRMIESNTLDDATRKILDIDCENRAALSYAAFHKEGREAVLQVYGTGCGERRSIFVFEYREGMWALLSDLRLSSHYDEQPTVAFPSLITTGVQEIMVEHQIIDWGSGFRQENTTIFRWSENHFEVVFDEAESIHLSVPITTSSGRHENYQLEQRSTFRVEAGKSGESELTEHQTLKQNNKEIVRVRKWIWEPTINRFRSYEAAP